MRGAQPKSSEGRSTAIAFIETPDGLINDRFIVLVRAHEEGYTVHYMYGSEMRTAEADRRAYHQFRVERFGAGRQSHYEWSGSSPDTTDIADPA